MITISQSIKLATNTGSIHPVLYKLYLSFMNESWKKPSRVRRSILNPDEYILEPGQFCLSPAKDWERKYTNQGSIKARQAKLKKKLKK